MSSRLRTARAEAAQVIKDAGHVAYSHVQARLTAPAAYIQPGSPYVESTEDSTFHHVDIRLEVVVVQRPGEHDKVGLLLDDHIEEVADALVDAGYALEQISQPFALEANGATYPAATITIRTDLEII